MSSPHAKTLAKFVTPLNMNGLRGRMLHLPPPKGSSKQILLVYGHHASLERFSPIAFDLNKYGAVTMPDLPGFGGMDSFYTIGKKPTLDNMADYLSSFIKLRYKDKPITIVGYSFGFVIVTRMLQRHPSLIKQVRLLVSASGFAHHDDFKFTKTRRQTYLIGARFFSHKLSAFYFKYICLQPFILQFVYPKTKNAKDKFTGLNASERQAVMNFEIKLWHQNNLRTHMSTLVSMLTLDNCKRRVALPVWHVGVKDDLFFDNDMIEQHMKVVFSDFQFLTSSLKNHGPSLLLNNKTARGLIPLKLRRLLK